MDRKQNVKHAFVQTVYKGAMGYPERLCYIPDAPQKLYYEGELPGNNVHSVAIIGARECTEYGRSMARIFAEALAKKGVYIISGMATGIDGIAQRSALEAGGKSFGVLGCGTDICYPRSNQGLYEDLKKKGGLISEYLPGTLPKRENFPRRNRLISGLADIVLVIEAKEKSGTGITVNTALEQGKDVFAVPGRVGDAMSAGCNRMISEGAGIALSPDILLQELEKKYRVP